MINNRVNSNDTFDNKKTALVLIVELYSAFHNNGADKYLNNISDSDKALLLDKLVDLKNNSEQEDKELEAIITLVEEAI